MSVYFELNDHNQVKGAHKTREIVNSTVTIWSTPRLPYGVLHMAHIYNIMEYSTGWRYGVLHMVINSGIMEYSTDGNMEYSISYVNETSWST